MSDEYWQEEEEPEEVPDKEQIKKMFQEMEEKAKKMMKYLELEGFIEKTDTPGCYKYTPEGLVLAEQKYKKMLEDLDEGI